MALSFPFSLHLFTSHLLSPSPSASSSSSSSSSSANYLPTIQINSPSTSVFSSSKLEISISSDQNLDIHHANPSTKEPRIKKKKRKPRPSFCDQTHERWSIKIASQRTKFPWQESINEEKHSQPAALSPSVPIPVDFSKDERIQAVIRGPINAKFPFTNHATLAPWAHGTHQRKTYLDSGSTFESSIGEQGDKGVQCKETKKIAATVMENLKESEYDSHESVGKISVFLDSEEEERSKYSKKTDTFSSSIITRDSIRLPWERDTELEGERRKTNTELAEATVPEPELRRLRNVALRMKERMKVGAGGVTQTIVDKINESWKLEEVVKIKFEGPPAINMKRTHEILEKKTSGLVIWRSGSSIVLYRGMTYKLSCVQTYTKQPQVNRDRVPSSKDSSVDVKANDMMEPKVGCRTSFQDPSGELTDTSEIEDMLDELGPRYQDWSGFEPLPVDADLLPSVVSGYKPPIRLLPYGVRHCLHNKEMTFLRRHARKMHPHFALGRNKQLQGLSRAMVKLWEKSSLAKIAIKRGVPNTSNERMAEEIKRLTGGTLLSRNKEYIVFYRGNDFLSPAIKEALVERKKLERLKQDEEEDARLRASALMVSNAKTARGPFLAGTLAETVEAKSRWGKEPTSEEREKMMRDEALSKHASLVRYLEKKLARAQEKVKKAEKALGKVQISLTPAELPTDLEIITDEERFLFRKIGLSMKPFLLLGRRGVFDGTIENMHLHWKYRELVKILVKGQSFPQVKHIAISLEAESGGVLISLDKTTKGYVIIIYRGKNYSQPTAIRPKNLLTRRQALARSIELQRREALKSHLSHLWERILVLKSELEQMEAVKEMGDENLYSRLDGAYSSDEDLEDEGEEAYLETYSGDEDVDMEIEESTSEEPMR